jgi:hypothetical protein
MNLHPVFYVSLLEPCVSTSILDRVFPPPPPVYLAKGPEYKVQSICDSKIMRNKLYYLVDWLGYTPNDRTWEPAENVANAPQLLEEFHRAYPNKPGPSSWNSSLKEGDRIKSTKYKRLVCA